MSFIDDCFCACVFSTEHGFPAWATIAIITR